MIVLEEITTVAALEALRPEWSALLERDPHATPFQSPEWLLSWWHSFGRGELSTLALRREGVLVGLAPFYIATMPEEDLRVLSWIGTGITDCLDLILDSDAAQPAASLIYEQLVRGRSRWDRCDLQELRTGSPLLAVLPTDRRFLNLFPQEACPVISLPTAVERFWETFPAERRRKLRRARRYLERSGRFSIERAAEETLPECLDALFRLHRSRWEGAGPPRRIGRSFSPGLSSDGGGRPAEAGGASSLRPAAPGGNHLGRPCVRRQEVRLCLPRRIRSGVCFGESRRPPDCTCHRGGNPGGERGIRFSQGERGLQVLLEGGRPDKLSPSH